MQMEKYRWKTVHTYDTERICNGCHTQVCNGQVENEFLPWLVYSPHDSGDQENESVSTCPDQEGDPHDDDIDDGECRIGVQEGLFSYRHHGGIVQTKTFLKCII